MSERRASLEKDDVQVDPKSVSGKTAGKLLDGVAVRVAVGAFRNPTGTVEHCATAAAFDVHGGPCLVSSDAACRYLLAVVMA